MRKRCLFAGLIGIALFASALADDSQLSPEQMEVWAGEEAYWEYVNAGKTDEFLALWHERFKGWPCDSEYTAELSDLEEFVAEWFADFATHEKSTTIEPEAVIVDEEFAVTYLSARTAWTDADGQEMGQLEKLVHTWKRTDDGWKIIGGMCGPLVRE